MAIYEPQTISQMFLDRVRAHPDKMALRHKYLGICRDVTWAEYLEHVRSVTLELVSLGVKPGDRVAVVGENRPEWLYADTGTICLGAVTVGIYTTSSAQQCEYVASHCAARVYIAEDEEQLDKALFFRDRTPALEKIVVIDTEGVKGFSDPMVMTFEELLEMERDRYREEPDLFERLAGAIQPNDLALIIYTSGTTGPPKGAMLSHYNVTWTSWSVGGGVQNEVDSVNKTLSHVETVKKFTIVPKKLYDDGEVTPTMKIKRKYINEKFADLIRAMYKAAP